MSKINKIHSYRGYVSSRLVDGNKIPQSLQNLKIRDYAISKKLNIKLSITEYKMNKSYFALNSLKNEANKLKGVIFFSIYQLPIEKKIRKSFLNFFIKKKKKLFFALEDIQIKNQSDINEVELIFFITKSVNKN